jgi:predicted acetyltransferase
MWDVRNITEAEDDLFRARISLAFGRDLDSDESARERYLAIFERERSFAAFDGDDIVGTVTAFSLGVTVPGGAEVPMGGTTVIGVKPTHRRRGVLRALMDRHLAEIAERGEPLAGLWSSEGTIYGRFGYGPATFRHVMEATTTALRFNPVSGPEATIRLLDPDKAGPVIQDIYERARGTITGALTRSEAWWQHRVLADLESWRAGKSKLRYAVAEVAGAPMGYALYRQKASWDDFIATGELQVEELITVDPAARRELWRFLVGIDLFPNLDYWAMPLDDPLPHLVTDQRQVRRTAADALWIRIMDIPAAMQARTYESDGVVTFQVLASGRDGPGQAFRLEVTDGVGDCQPTTGETEIELPADVLGHLYLGGGDATAMAAAGRVDGDTEAVARLDKMLRTTRAPWCPEVF